MTELGVWVSSSHAVYSRSLIELWADENLDTTDDADDCDVRSENSAGLSRIYIDRSHSEDREAQGLVADLEARDHANRAVFQRKGDVHWKSSIGGSRKHCRSSTMVVP